MPGIGGTPPRDDAAMVLAQQWIASAQPPPGVRALDAAPASGPKRPATEVACDWLVRATKWWSTDSAHAAAASAWLTQHPVDGLVTDGTMTGPGDLTAIFEHSPQKQNDSVEFEFAPSGDSVTIRVDVTIVPAGAQCNSTGGAAQTGPGNSAGR
ncbi:hypothetical protein GCM10009820_14530 [Leifsonia soli]